jgi:Flp pilus assembly pilin Flp
MLAWVASVWQDCRGTSAVEFALIASLVSIAAVAGFKALGSNIGNQYTHIGNSMSATPGGNP